MNINPFAGVGNLVHGDQFIGRKKELDKIISSVTGENYNCIAIMGLPRMGKSSLAWRAKEIIEADNNKGSFIVWLNPPAIYTKENSALNFFKTMVEKADEEILSSNELDFDKYNKITEKTLIPLKSETDERQIRLIIQKYFKFIKKILGFKLIFILDEFDGVKDYFEVADFQLLRELAYNPDTRICLITTSRKTIDDIEAKNGAISNFAGIFGEVRLGVFSKEDEEMYWSHFQNEWPVDKQYKEDILFFAGRHPFLMDKINFDLYCQQKKSAKECGQDIELMNNLDNIISTLEKENILNAAIQLVIGPLYDVNQKQIEQLEKYQFIRKITIEEKEKIFGASLGPKWDDYAYVCFSDFCTLDFYRRYYANVPYVAIWSETENSLRDIIKKHINNDDIDLWKESIESFLQTNPPYPTWDIEKWEKKFDSLKNNQDNMMRRFPQLSGSHFVDFTLTSQIFDIFIQPEQKWYNEHIFQGSWRDWTNKFNFLKNLRDPVAHNNSFEKLESEMEIARQYCQEIKNAIVKAQ